MVSFSPDRTCETATPEGMQCVVPGSAPAPGYQAASRLFRLIHEDIWLV